MSMRAGYVCVWKTGYKENMQGMIMSLDPGMRTAPVVMWAKCALSDGATTSTLREECFTASLRGASFQSQIVDTIATGQ